MAAMMLILMLVLNPGPVPPVGAATADPPAVEVEAAAIASPAAWSPRDAETMTAPGRGPDIVLIDELVRLYGAVRFDHALHAGMAQLETGCAACHHGETDAGDGLASCRTCHPPVNGAVAGARVSLKAAYHRQCLGCHRDWSHANACGFCHAESTGAAPAALDPETMSAADHPRLVAQTVYVYDTGDSSGPFVTFNHADHVEQFGARCVDCHRDTSCDGCHGPRHVSPPVDRHDRCYGCHAEANCAFCHDQTARPRFDHAVSIGWDLTPHHGNVTCAKCHGESRSFQTPDTTNCRACHGRFEPDRFDHMVTGVPLAGSHAHFECARCHQSRSPDAPAACNGCHPNTSYPEDWPGRHRSPHRAD